MSTAKTSGTVARLKSQLQDKAAAQELRGTPAHFDQRTRSQAEKAKVQAETARKMAARFNLTYRSLELSTARKAAELRERDLKAQKEAKEAMGKYNMTARALKMSATGTGKGKVRVLPGAGGVVQQSHDEPERIVDDFEKVNIEAQKKPSASTTAQPPAEQAGKKTESDDEEDDEVADMQSLVRRSLESAGGLSRITEASKEHQHEEHDAFWMPELARAVASQDPALINLACVKDFFAAHDPERMGEAEELLKAHAGREERLMESLNEQYSEVVVVADDARGSDLGPMTLNVSAENQVTASPNGGGGFILSGVKQTGTDSFVVNTADPAQAAVLRQRMLAKGVKAEAVESVVGDVSEML